MTQPTSHPQTPPIPKPSPQPRCPWPGPAHAHSLSPQAGHHPLTLLSLRQTTRQQFAHHCQQGANVDKRKTHTLYSHGGYNGAKLRKQVQPCQRSHEQKSKFDQSTPRSYQLKQSQSVVIHLPHQG